MIKDDFEILKINCDFEDAYSIEWLEFFILLSYFKKKKFKTRKCNILVLPVRFMNELYIRVYYYMWQVVLD